MNSLSLISFIHTQQPTIPEQFKIFYYVLCFKKILIKHIYLWERVKLQWQKLVFNGDLEIIVIQNGLCVFLVSGEKIESKQSSLTLFKLTPSQRFHSCLGELGVDIESLASGIVVGIAYTHTLSLYHIQTHTFWANTWCDYNKINCVYKFGLFHFLLQLRAFNFWNLLIISSSRNIKSKNVFIQISKYVRSSILLSCSC